MPSRGLDLAAGEATRRQAVARRRMPSYHGEVIQGTKSTIRAKTASWLWLAAVALAPLPFGSTEPTTIAFWCIILGGSLMLVPMPVFRGGRCALIVMAALVVAAYALVLHEQLAEHPWLAKANPLWRDAGQALGTPLEPSVAVARNQPWFALGRPLLCTLAVACGFLIGADERRSRQLMKVIGWSGAVYAAYGIIAHLFDPNHILGIEKKAYLESVTGTFINRNTAAAYFGSCSVVWSLLLWERLRLGMPHGRFFWRALKYRLFVAAPKGIVIRFAMLMLCVVAMFMTASRAGVVLSLLALIVAFCAFFRRDLTRHRSRTIAVAGGGAAALVLMVIMGGRVSERFDWVGFSDEGRFETYRSTLRMIRDHPWFGTGQGTFAYAFPTYRGPNPSVWGVWGMAHSTLLEIGADMGIPIALVVVAAWSVIFAVLIYGVAVRRRTLVVPIAALSVALLAVLHSLIDFTLQIPGYSIVALSLVGAGLAQSFPTERGKAKPEPVMADSASPALSTKLGPAAEPASPIPVEFSGDARLT